MSDQSDTPQAQPPGDPANEGPKEAADSGAEPKPDTPASPAPPAAPAAQAALAEAPARDRWIVPLALLALLLWGLFVFFCAFVVPAYAQVYTNMRERHGYRAELPIYTRVVLGLRETLPLVSVGVVAAIFTLMGLRAKQRGALIALTVMAALALGGSYFALNQPYWQFEARMEGQ